MSRVRPPWHLGLLLLAATVFLALLVARWPRSTSARAASTPAASGKPSLDASPQRLVSLAPAVTETLLALGAKDRLVGVSQYCRETDDLPRVGTAITPRFEAIARLAPTLILTSQVAGEQMTPLTRIAPTKQLPWLSLSEVVSSIRELGTLVDRAAEGNELANRMHETLSRQAPSTAPRVLLTMSYGDTGSQEIWFIRRNSLHGAALSAAGGRNAVDEDVAGQPHLSVEELLRLDPDQIILLSDSQRATEAETLASVERLRKLTPLSAVRHGKLGFVRAPDAFSGGPRVLDLVEPLRREINRLDARR